MENIEVFDFQRMFIGDAPIAFLLEIIFRTVIMYAYTIILLRFLGKRGMGQLSTLEVAIIICFGSAIGDPMLGADVPILYGIVSVTTVAFLQVGMERVINSNKKVEVLLEGKADYLIEKGIILYENLKLNNLSHEDLFRSLRENGVEHLGQVKGAFFETSGQISVMMTPENNVNPGLSVLPEELIPKSSFVDDHVPIEASNFYSCLNCGFTKKYDKGKILGKCPSCGCRQWMLSDRTGSKAADQ